MDRQPLVSIIIPTYNRGKLLKKAIESVLNQTYQNIEVVIVDDCSTDGTWEIISEYRDRDSRIVAFKNETNLGFSKNLNKGVSLAQGEYIARLDDDDFWIDPEKLKKQIEFLENNKEYVLTGGGSIWIDEKGKEILRLLMPEKDKDIRKHILSDNCFVHSTVVFRKKAWEAAGEYNERFGVDSDWGLWLELGKFGKFYNFPEYFTYYLQWAKSISNFDVRRNSKIEIGLRREYRRDYPGYFKAFFLGWAYYFYSFLPFRKKWRSLLLKLRTLIFGAPPYKYFKK